MSGLVSYLAGRNAEDQVMQRYIENGYRLLGRRWRGGAGEIDLIFETGGEVVFVEVKKSRSFAKAALRLSQHQIARILKSAEDCLGNFPRQSLTPMRVDVALVDQHGRIEMVPNALMA